MTASAERITVPTKFEILPTTCMTLTPQSKCQMELIINWQHHIPFSGCVVLDKSQLKCWKGQRSGQLVKAVTVDESSKISFVESKTKQALFEKSINIRYVHPKNQRRRLRSDWSIF
ncbi:DUF3019 domain-containing protein [Colwellia sp. MEBiC06753]